MSQYFKHPVALTFVYQGALYRKFMKVGSRKVEAGHLSFDLHFLGRSFTKYEEVLNEAKLSAVALAVYFASLIEGIPQGSSGYPRILVLDDVLIGLDMSNRLPVLEILEKEFADKGWQIILLTHDKVWYDYTPKPRPCNAIALTRQRCIDVFISKALGTGMLGTNTGLNIATHRRQPP